MVLGGGRRNFLHANTSDPEYPDENGVRLDGDLTEVNIDTILYSAFSKALTKSNDIPIKCIVFFVETLDEETWLGGCIWL